MIDLHLRADDEAALAAALPLLRGTDADGRAVWLLSGHHHALDLGFTVETSPAVVDRDGRVVTPAALDPRCHANLRLLDTHPDRDAILAAAEPLRVEPNTPRRVFA